MAEITQELKEFEKKRYNYFVPDVLGKVMQKVTIQVQLEANLLSMTFMSIGLIVSMFYMFFYFNIALWYKIFLIFNALAGLLFFTSTLVTTYQQYQNVMEIMEFQKQQKEVTQNV